MYLMLLSGILAQLNYFYPWSVVNVSLAISSSCENYNLFSVCEIVPPVIYMWPSVANVFIIHTPHKVRVKSL